MSGGAGRSLTPERIAAAVAAQQDWMLELLERLVAAPTVLGGEEPGQKVIAEAFAELGLEPVDVPMDGAALRTDPTPRPSPGTSRASATCSPPGAAPKGRRVAR